MIRKYTSGGDATIEIGGELEAWLMRGVREATAGAIDVMEAAAETHAGLARSQWYSLVTRRTGKSGDIQVITTISPEQIKVSVGSTDSRKIRYFGKSLAKAQNREVGNSREIMVAAFVHSPGPFSTIMKPCTREEYFAAPISQRGPARSLVIRKGVGKTWQEFVADNPEAVAAQFLIRVPNPKAGQRIGLLATLVRGPMRRIALRLPAEIASETARRING